MTGSNTTNAVQGLLDRLAEDGMSADEGLIRELLSRAAARLQHLCGRVLHQRYPRLTRNPAYVAAEDLLGAVVERLIKAMRELRPRTAREFFGLAGRHVRWELNDLARRVDQQRRTLPLEDGDASARNVDHDPQDLVRILDAIARLPDAEREVFELVRVHGLTQGDAADLLGVAEKTVQRRLARSVLLLAKDLRDVFPDTGVADALDGSEARE